MPRQFLLLIAIFISFSAAADGILVSWSPSNLTGMTKEKFDDAKTWTTSDILTRNTAAAAAATPTSGWTQISYTYSIQTPWNLAQSAHYMFPAGSIIFGSIPPMPVNLKAALPGRVQNCV